MIFFGFIDRKPRLPATAAGPGGPTFMILVR
jgi:hypothetical protein